MAAATMRRDGVDHLMAMGRHEKTCKIDGSARKSDQASISYDFWGTLLGHHTLIRAFLGFFIG
jgi:hypothetical protein